MDVFVARQPIFDRTRQLYAYELLFRSGDLHNEFDGTDSGSATTQVIANSLLTFGLENVACGKRVFVNFDYSLLMGGLHAILPRETTVLEILESVEPNEELIAVCHDLTEQGYTFALDDFVDQPSFEPLTQLAKLIKVDMSHRQAGTGAASANLPATGHRHGGRKSGDAGGVRVGQECGLRLLSRLLFRASGRAAGTPDPGSQGQLLAAAPRDAV
jgi:c-di-GMP-related signal transduction protein